MVDKLSNTKELNLAGSELRPRRERISKIDLKAELSMMNQLIKMVYGKGAAKVDDKIDLGILWKIKNADK